LSLKALTSPAARGEVSAYLRRRRNGGILNIFVNSILA